MTVLFADAKGSTALTERIGDEAMYRLMQHCVQAMHDIVERHDGTVTQFRGDGVMALFGAPVATEDAAVKGVSAALEIQAALTSRIEQLERDGTTGCEFRVGLNTGPVVVGRIGEDTLVDYTAIGDTANVAARMEQSAGAGEVYVAEPTWRAVRDYVDCEPVGSLDLAGKEEPLDAYRAVRRRDVASRFDAAAARGLSPFVGRDLELALLRDGVADLQAGRGRVVCLVGEAGIGKSRLVRELRTTLPDGVGFARGRSSSADRRAPWHVVVDLVRDLLDITDDHTAAEIATVVDDALADRREPSPAAGHLRWLLGVSTDDGEQVDPLERRTALLEAIAALLHATSELDPLVVVLEDLHWADEASMAAARVIAGVARESPVLVVATYRSDADQDRAEGFGATVLNLGALDADAAAGMAAALAGNPLSAAATNLVVEHCGGNPLFVEELTAALLETGVLVHTGNDVDISRDVDTTDLPASIQDVVLTRIDRLDVDARNALQLASVVGREFTRRVLDRIAAIPDGLDRQIIELESLELIRQRAWYPELAYLFKHAIVHDVTYSTLLDQRRRELHALVATAIEELYADQLADHADALARHWLEAGEPLRALPHLIAAGDRAMAGLSAERAAEVYGQAADLAEEHDRIDVAISVRIARVSAYSSMSDFATAESEATRLLELCERFGDPCRTSLAMAHLGEVHEYAHRFEEALALIQRGADLARGQPGCDDALATNLVELFAVMTILGRTSDATSVAEELEPLLQRALPDVHGRWDLFVWAYESWTGSWHVPESRSDERPDPGGRVMDRIFSDWFIEIARAAQGDYLAAIEGLERLAHANRRLGFDSGLGRMLNSLGWIHGELGNHARAVTLNEESLTIAERLDIPNREIEANARQNLADDAMRLGDLAEVGRHLDSLQPTVLSPTPPDRFMYWRWTMRWWCIRGELDLLLGNHDAALAAADTSLETAVETNSRKYIVRGQRLRGRALAAAGDTAGAERELDAALAIARDIGNPPQLWRTLIARAETFPDRRTDDATEALEVIDGVVASLGDHPLAAALAASPERANAVALST